MRWSQESAASRRDAQLARTRKLTVQVAGGAAVASVALAGVLGTALPGHTASTAGKAVPSSGTPAGSGTATGTTAGGGTGTGADPSHAHRTRHHGRHHLAPPAHQPAPATAPPVVSSGGS
jgi:hypothetical protein